MTETPNLKLKKHDPGEKFDYKYLNHNADILDTEIKVIKEIGGLDLQEITAAEVETLFE